MPDGIDHSSDDTDRSDRGIEPVAALPLLVAIASLCILVGLFAAVVGGAL
jgi:FlaG/FlaF family flagellin (archaellin)